jgi:hypothetical protein
MEFLKIFLGELVLFFIYLYFLKFEIDQMEKKIFSPKKKKVKEIKLRGENYPFE